MAEISLYFNAKTDLLMSSVSEACKVEKNGESFSSSEESYGENLNISSEAEFFGVAFTDVWYEKKSDTFYVLAYIDRNEALSVYRDRKSVV